MNVISIVEKAKQSGLYRKILNIGLSRLVPFNKPHGFKITEIDDYYIKAQIPYKKANFNHIRGIHACALATISEFTTGFLLLTRLDPKKYRLIMQSLQMEYHYQAKMNCTASFRISEDWMDNNIFQPLRSSEKVIVACNVSIHDADGNHISTGLVNWQIKSWDQVKTAI